MRLPLRDPDCEAKLGVFFEVHLWDTGDVDSQHKLIFIYAFYDKAWHERPIFTGNDFAVPPGGSCTERALELFGWMSLREGDTDPDYFKHYTKEQLEWRDERAEGLALEVAAIENAREQSKKGLKERKQDWRPPSREESRDAPEE